MNACVYVCVCVCMYVGVTVYDSHLSLYLVEMDASQHPFTRNTLKGGLKGKGVEGKGKGRGERRFRYRYISYFWLVNGCMEA